MKCKREGCNAPALKRGEGFCFWHDPQAKNRVREAGRRGGRRGKIELEAVAVETLVDVRDVLNEALNELRLTGSESIIQKARAIGYIASILIIAIERGDLEKRITELEEKFLESK